MANHADLRKRVSKGIRRLDKYIPDWVDKVDPDTLDMRGGGNCILEQVTGGNYIDALALVHMSTNWQEIDADVAHGFMEKPNSRKYAELTEEWKRRIILRKRKVARSVV